MIRVLIVDDHAIVRIGVKKTLAGAGIECVGETGRSAEAAELAAALKPDVTLLDLRMPDLDGLDVLKAILARDAAARVVMLSSFDLQEDIYRAIKAGAKGYLLKDCGADALADGIRKVASGGMCFSERALAEYEARKGMRGLSARETQVAELVAKGLTAEDIARILGINVETVRKLVRRIITKTGMNSRTGAVMEAIKRGIIRTFGVVR